MWLQRFTHYLLKHRIKTVLLTFIISFLPIVGTLGILIAALITLFRGSRDGAILTAAATLPYLISFYVSGHHETTIPLVIWAAVGVAVTSNILTYVFAVMLYRQTSWSVAIQIAALLGVLVISVLHLAYPNISDWWGKELLLYYQQAAEAGKTIPVVGVNEVKDTQVTAMINSSKQSVTGVLTGAILFSALLQLVVARWWQILVTKTGSLQFELHHLRLSRLAGVLFLASLFFSYLGNPVVLDIMPVLFLLFAVAGLSLLHYFFGLMHSKTVWFWIAMMYLTLFFSMPMSIVLVAFIAWLDIWLDGRKRFKRV